MRILEKIVGWLKNNWTATLAGTMLTLFFTQIIEPVFSALYSFILSLGGTAIQSLSDSTYRQISNGFSEQTSSLILYLAYIVSSVVILNFFTSYRKEYKQCLSELKDIEKEIHSLSSSEQSEEDAAKNEPDSRQPEEHSKQILDKIAAFRSRSFSHYIILGIITFAAYILLIYAYSRTVFVNGRITSMMNNIEIVSPYISDIEYKQFKSSFHLIENKEDYDNLYSQLERVAASYSIQLKK